jgi:hypothetical protein
MSIPQDGNFLGLSCQLGGLRLNGIAGNTPYAGTAPSLRFVTIDDPNVVKDVTPNSIVGYLEVKIGNVDSTGIVGNFELPFYIPLYQ